MLSPGFGVLSCALGDTQEQGFLLWLPAPHMRRPEPFSRDLEGGAASPKTDVKNT